MKISIIIPAYDEEENVIPLCKGIMSVMGGLDYEIMFVDDGSKDKTYSNAMMINSDKLKIIRLEKHKGKCFALYQGIAESSGDIIALIDSDLQNDPKDIPNMIEKLNGGYDFVCGWRNERADGPLKKMLSRTGNFFNNKILGIDLHDNNCPVKVFRRNCVSNIRYFRNFHRFIPAMVKIQGFRITEVGVSHFPRIHGVSKYGIHDRIFGNLMTMIMIRFMNKHLLE